MLRPYEEGWLTDVQQNVLEANLHRCVPPERAGNVGEFLHWAEMAALDVAALGLVLRVTSGDFINQLIWREWATPTVKTDAGWPNSLWHPPSTVLPSVEDLLRERTVSEDRAQESVIWAEATLDRWWRLATLFVSGATLVGLDGGFPVVEPSSSIAEPVPSTSALGELLPASLRQDWAERCSATYQAPYATAGPTPRVSGTSTEQCPFRARPSSIFCSVHEREHTGRAV